MQPGGVIFGWGVSCWVESALGSDEDDDWLVEALN